MIYLLAKYTLLFLITTILGFVLGYWWSRRSFVDVSESYESMKKSNDKREWNRLWGRLDAMPAPKEPDLSGINSRLDKLTNVVDSVPVVETHAAANLSPVNARLSGIETSIKSIPAPSNVNLSRVEGRLDAIEIELQKLGQRLENQQAREPEPVMQKSDNEPVILSAALYGNKDDLKQISGVGPKLERLLNGNGVYYFWQVASWSKDDIEFIDDRLDVFRGRISRDNWVRQAKSLKVDSASARMPTR